MRFWLRIEVSVSRGKSMKFQPQKYFTFTNLFRLIYFFLSLETLQPFREQLEFERFFTVLFHILCQVYCFMSMSSTVINPYNVGESSPSAHHTTPFNQQLHHNPLSSPPGSRKQVQLSYITGSFNIFESFLTLLFMGHSP